MLRYLVEHTLKGDADKINEYAIGLEVFQRPASFDPRIESVVRTEFSRLRQRLRDYYAEDGRRDSIVIEFPPRSYVASFTFRDPSKLREPTAFPEPSRGPQAAPPSARSGWRTWLIGAIAVPCIAAAVAGIMLWRQHVSIVAGGQPIHAIVVLPFEDYSPNHQDEYIADGITEELTNDLAQWRDLRVVARTSAFAFKGKGEDVREIGRQLNVDAVLEGSFTRDGNQMRVTAQLNRATDGFHLWSHSYETQSNDMLAMQDEVATSITDAIRHIGGGSPPVIRPPTTNNEALDLYLQGEYQNHLRTTEALAKAISLFQKAIEKDPNFARAYVRDWQRGDRQHFDDDDHREGRFSKGSRGGRESHRTRSQSARSLRTAGGRDLQLRLELDRSGKRFSPRDRPGRLAQRFVPVTAGHWLRGADSRRRMNSSASPQNRIRSRSCRHSTSSWPTILSATKLASKSQSSAWNRLIHSSSVGRGGRWWERWRAAIADRWRRTREPL